MSGVVFEMTERPESRKLTRDPPSCTYVYNCSGEDNDQIALGYVTLNSPLFIVTLVANLFRNNIELDPVGFRNYKATVTYGQKKNDVGTFDFSFDTTGATIRIKAAKEHIASYPATGAGGSNPFKGMIGVDKDMKVEGTDIVVPALKLTYTFKHPSGVVNETFAKTLAGATGCTNLNPFRDFDTEELLFLGAKGADGTETDAQVTYEMVASQNAEGLTIGDITGIVKKGHHYLWIETKDAVDSGRPAVQPRRVHVERVYDPIDFVETFGWGG